MNYIEIKFATPEARVRYSEAALENRARDIAAFYGSNWENELVFAARMNVLITELLEEIAELDRAREAIEN